MEINSAWSLILEPSFLQYLVNENCKCTQQCISNAFYGPQTGKKKKAYRQQNRINLFFKLPMWSITVHPAQLDFQLPRGLFSLACHVAWMIYFQYTVSISNKFAIWINWKHEIMTIAFASLAVLLLSFCTIILYLCTKKGKHRKEEDDFRKKSSREMEKRKKRVEGLWIGKEKEKY